MTCRIKGIIKGICRRAEGPELDRGDREDIRIYDHDSKPPKKVKSDATRFGYVPLC